VAAALHVERKKGQAMSKLRSVVESVLFPLALVCCATPARADPVRVTSGYVEAGFGALGTPWIAEALYLRGAGLDIGTSLEDTSASLLLSTSPKVTPGAFVDFSGILRVGDAVGAMLNNEFGILAAPMTMAFNAAPSPLACSGNSALTECTGLGRFTLDADLTFTPFGGAAVTEHLVGAGMVEGRLFRTQSFEGGAVRYTFDASPVPEPGTLWLFGAGAMVAGAGAWCRRRPRAA
jgi:hypothetical protein